MSVPRLIQQVVGGEGVSEDYASLCGMPLNDIFHCFLRAILNRLHEHTAAAPLHHHHPINVLSGTRAPVMFPFSCKLIFMHLHFSAELDMMSSVPKPPLLHHIATVNIVSAKKERARTDLTDQHRFDLEKV